MRRAHALTQRSVRYVLIGVSGANLHAPAGQVIFTTEDFDLVLQDDPENLTRGETQLRMWTLIFHEHRRPEHGEAKAAFSDALFDLRLDFPVGNPRLSVGTGHRRVHQMCDSGSLRGVGDG